MFIKRSILALFSSIFLLNVSATGFDKALENNDIQAAELIVKSLAATEGKSLATQVMQGRILMAKDKSEQAYDLLEVLRKEHKDNVELEYYFGLSAAEMAQKASIFSKLGYAEDVLEAWEKVVELDPQHIQGLNHLIGFHLAAPGIAGGDKDKALVLAKQLQGIDLEKGAQQLANVYWQVEKAKQAEETIAQALIKLPESSGLHFTQASAYMRAEEWQKATNGFSKAIKYAKTAEQKSHALYQQGKLSAESGQSIEVGIAALTEVSAMGTSPYQNWLAFRLAQLHLHKKDIEQANTFIAQVNTDDDKELKKRVKKLKKKIRKLKS